MTDYKTIGRRLAERRRVLGLRQAELAERADLSDKYISNIERAYSIPSIEVILRLCDALETTPNHILLGTEQSDTDKYTQLSKKLTLIPEDQLPLLERMMDALIEFTAPVSTPNRHHVKGERP